MCALKLYILPEISGHHLQLKCMGGLFFFRAIYPYIESTTVIHNSNTDLGSNSNSNLLILKVIVLVIHYINLGNYGNSNNYTDF